MHGKKYRWSKPFEGVLDNLRRRMEETESDSVRERLSVPSTERVYELVCEVLRRSR